MSDRQAMETDFYDAFDRATASRDAKTAIVFADEPARSYRDLKQRAHALAAHLQATGVKAGARVALVSRNGPWFYDLLLGCALLHAVLVPLNPKLSQNEIAYILDDCAPALVVAADALAASIPQQYQSRLMVVERNLAALTGNGFTRTSIAHSDSPLLQIYTSGTTGHPKGAVISHGNVLSVAREGQRFLGSFTSDDISLVCLPLFHIAGIDWAVFGLLSGGTTILLPEVDADAAAVAIAQYAVTKMLLVPAVIRMLVERLEQQPADTTSVTTLCFGASPMPEALLDRARRVFPAAAMIHVYGLSETTGMFTYLPPQSADDKSMVLSCGIPFPSGEIGIVDQQGATVGPHVRGEIVYRGPQLMLGYWNNAVATAAAIKDGWFHTGDIGYRDENGNLFVCDRLKDMVKSGDENVFPAEVENVLSKHPAIADCAVIGLSDPTWGEVVTAIVVLRPHMNLALDQLRAFARMELAGYKLPRKLIVADSLPRNAAGKVLKHVLREAARTQHGPDAAAGGAAAGPG